MKIANKVFVVTGGASGLGEAAAVALAEKGGRVAILDRDEEAAAEVVSRLGEGNAKFFIVDICDSRDIERAIAQVAEAALLRADACRRDR